MPSDDTPTAKQIAAHHEWLRKERAKKVRACWNAWDKRQEELDRIRTAQGGQADGK